MIYLLNADNTNLYKIGCSINLKHRIKVLQTGCPYKLKLIHSVDGSPTGEKKLHKLWNHLRKEGEWFELKTDFVLNKVCSDMDSINKNTFETNKEHLEKWREHYEERVRSGYGKPHYSSYSDLLDLAMVEIVLNNNEVALQRLIEYKQYVVCGMTTQHNLFGIELKEIIFGRGDDE